MKRFLIIAGTAACALVLWLVEHAVLGTDPAIRSGSSTQSVGGVAVVAVALIVGFAAWGLLALLERVTTAGRRVWTVIAAVVLVLSLLGPLGGVTGGAKLALALLHLCVGGLLLAFLPRTAAQP
ncbi:DUF6069 family protein [Hamadaea tsunoensis]|uniref:DUF6069 family protein n=1 Tax=Hamadaea tsunoensis TaxID=53368 RepID=UPI00054F98FA|nr:DUF6069 family protein [Hamadaea tsunoensis]